MQILLSNASNIDIGRTDALLLRIESFQCNSIVENVNPHLSDSFPHTFFEFESLPPTARPRLLIHDYVDEANWVGTHMTSRSSFVRTTNHLLH